jgi:oligoendopeptidase F
MNKPVPCHSKDALSSAQEITSDENWKLTDLFRDDEAFHQWKEEVRNRIPALDSFQGRLAESAETLTEALTYIDDLAKELSKLHAYASMRSDGDSRVQACQAMRQEIGLIWNELSRRSAWLRPEILSIDEDLLDHFMGEHKALDNFRFYLHDLLRTKPHVLSRPEEDILAAAGLVTSAAPSIFNVFHNAEQPRESVTLEDGTNVELTPAEFSKHRATSVRTDRKKVYEGYFRSYERFRGTLGQNLYECMKAHVFRARTRRYDSCLDAALGDNCIPTRVYNNLIEQVHGYLPLLHRYFGLRGRALGVDRIEYHDLNCPLVAASSQQYSTAEAERWVRQSTRPLGETYAGALDACFSGRWIDWHPTAGKRSGAYASGAAYDVHPYILLNYNGDYDSVSTLTHEVGHAVHSWFSNHTQPHPNANYSIFVAEVASTFNEALLNAAMLEEAGREGSDEHQVFLLGSYLDGMRATMFRQTMFAEFELAIHQEAEADRPLTGDRFSTIYLDLLRRYHGHEEGVMEIPEHYAIEWAGIPHFYFNFYVYQYATGIIAANALAEAVREGREGARDRYLKFLTTGGSDYPLELLRGAGVDLEAAGPYFSAMNAMSRNMDRLETLLDRIGR